MSSPLLGILLATFAVGQTSDPTPADIRQAVERSLPYLEKEGLAWMNDRNCLSCHVVSFTLWSHNEAKAAGVKVDAKKLQELTDRSLEYSLGARQWYKVTDEAGKKLKEDGVADETTAKLKSLKNKSFVAEEPFVEALAKVLSKDELAQNKAFLLKRYLLGKTGEKNDGGSMATMGQLLNGRIGSTGPRTLEFLAAAPAIMIKWQEPTGAWGAGGQLPKQNRPKTESDAVTTAWGVLGLASLDKIDAPTQKSIDLGLAYFRKNKSGKSHETLLVSLLVEDKLGKPENAAALLKEVLDKQNADGGWAWTSGKASDAFATGQSLYALALVRAKFDPAVVRKAQKYLLAGQNKEGYWVTPPLAVTDQKSNETRLGKLVFIYDYWGTAWAAIGLSRSLSLELTSRDR